MLEDTHPLLEGREGAGEVDVVAEEAVLWEAGVDVVVAEMV